MLHTGDLITPLCRSQLEHHLLHLIQAHNIRSPIIQLGRPRALMRRHLLGFFEIPAIGQVNRDAGCPEGVAADFGLDTRSFSPPHRV
jgi:hypothetical protein